MNARPAPRFVPSVALAPPVQRADPVVVTPLGTAVVISMTGSVKAAAKPLPAAPAPAKTPSPSPSASTSTPVVAKVRARLCDAAGAPMHGAFFFAPIGVGPGLAAGNSGNVDDQGELVLDVAPGRWLVTATDGFGFPVARTELHVGPGEARVELIAPVLARVSGQIDGADQNCWTGRAVTITNGQGVYAMIPVDDGGRFSVALPPGDYAFESALFANEDEDKSPVEEKSDELTARLRELRRLVRRLNPRAPFQLVAGEVKTVALVGASGMSMRRRVRLRGAEG